MKIPTLFVYKRPMARPVQIYFTDTFNRFFASEKAGGMLLLACTCLSLVLANSMLSDVYRGFWHALILGMTLEHWINDGLMAIFFLFIGLELVRELKSGELSNFRHALLPIIAAAGGIVVPAGIHFAFNGGTPTANGVGIPMATDIAFALGVLALVGSRVPLSLKVFLTALAVMDDLGAIVVIAVFYTAKLSLLYLGGALAVFFLLMVVNRLRVMALAPYLLGGALMWFLMLKSGVHATIAGVLLAVTIPFSALRDDEKSPSHRLEHWLHRPVAFGILPIFALANTAVVIGAGWLADMSSNNSLGILLGLVAGKPVGILLACALAVWAGACRLPSDVRWSHILGAGMLGGIGFTMSIFIANLAFPGQAEIVNDSKMAILSGSLIAGVLGYVWLRWLSPRAKA
jgi:NhaA family Na+:H+ antiporter